MNEQQTTFSYDVALSFAGEDRPHVEQLAAELRRRNISVFYDKHEQAKLWGKNLLDYLSDLYANRCKYCVVFVSRAYAAKEWTKLERQSAQARALRQDAEFFLPVRLDDTELPGLLSTTAYVDLREQSLMEIADLICTKLGCNSKPQQTPGRHGRLVVELRSSFKCGALTIGGRPWEDQEMEKLIRAHKILLGATGTSDARIVGFETSPHRVQIQTVSEGYSNLRTKYLNGELNASTEIAWTAFSPLEGKERAPAPFQVPLAHFAGTPANSSEPERSVVCHLRFIGGVENQYDQGESCLGAQTTTDWKQFKAFVTCKERLLYLQSNFVKPGCKYSTKLATNTPVDLFTSFINLTLMDLPEAEQLAEAEAVHTKYAKYFIDLNSMGRRGDEFYSGAMNIRFI